MAEISPYYTPEGAPDSNPAVIAAMNIMQSTYLPKGIDDAGKCDGQSPHSGYSLGLGPGFHRHKFGPVRLWGQRTAGLALSHASQS